MSGADPRANDDRALVARCLAHERAAWDAFVVRFSRLIYGVIHETLRRHGGARDDEVVDELFHTAFLALYENNYKRLRQWSGRCSLASWIRLVTSSVVIDQLRRRRPMTPIDTVGAEGPVPDYLVDGAKPPVEVLVDAERAIRVREALESLAPADRELLLLLYRDDHSPAEIAERLEIKPGALYTRKNRALQRLREAFERVPEVGRHARGETGREDPEARPSMDLTDATAPEDEPERPMEGADGN